MVVRKQNFSQQSTTSSFECFFSFHYFGLELDKEDGLGWPELVVLCPMRRDSVRRETGSIAYALNDATNEGSAVELTHLLGDADVCIDEGIVVYNHVVVAVASASLESISRTPKQGAPQGRMYELQKIKQACWSRGCTGRHAKKEQIEKFDTYGVCRLGQPGLKVRNRGRASLVVCDQGVEEVSKGCQAQFGRASAVEVAVVDGLSIAGIAQGCAGRRWRQRCVGVRPGSTGHCIGLRLCLLR